jgi:hypothetical protein
MKNITTALVLCLFAASPALSSERIDHTRLTVRTAGIDRRLTDVHGHVVREILA